MIITKKLGILLFMAIFLAFCSGPQDTTVTKPEALNTLFVGLEEASLFNGVVLVAEKGEIIYKKAVGFSDFAKKEPITLQSAFEIGSISKPITAVAVLILVEKGLISLDDSLTKFFPGLPYEEVTPRELLSHTSGLFDVPSVGKLKDQFYAFYNRVDVPYTNKDYLAYLEKYNPPMEVVPGEKNIYSNTGYVLLALVVEKVCGEPFHEFLKKNIFEPAGMSRTILLSWPLVNKIKNLATGYYYNPIDGIIPESDHKPGVAVFGMSYGDDEIVSTADDMLAFDQALRNGMLVKPETLNMMFKPPNLNDGNPSRYGLGFVVSEEEGVRTISHGGSTAGFWAYCKFSTEDDESTVVLFTNVKSTLGTFRAIHGSIRRILRGQPVVMPSPSIVYSLAEHLEKHSVDDAKAIFNRLVDSGKYRLDVDPLLRLAELYRKSGETQKLRCVLECVLYVDPNNKMAKKEFNK